MPEAPEGIAHYLTTLWALALYGIGPWQVLALWADFTGSEAKAAGLNTGLVQRLHNRSTMQRGTNRRQTPLLAKELIRSPDNLSPIPITDLSLQAVHHSVRALIVDLGLLWLKLAYLTHTSVQVYPRAQWEVILQVPKKRRGFSVGLGIECSEFTLAFVSLDQLFQPTWATSRPSLGIELPYIYNSFFRFTERVCGWIRERWRQPRMDLAVHAIRDEPKVWVGVGAYTVNELFFIAGIPVGIRERDLFGNPSRTARLIDAFWALMHAAERDLPSLIRPSWKQGLLAPDRTQRRSYPNQMLHIYGKSKVFLPSRLVAFAQKHNQTVSELERKCRDEDLTWFRSEWDELFPDPYEPAYSRAAYEAPEAVKYQFGHLIWGRERWAIIQAHFGFPDAREEGDHLTRMFEDLGCDLEKTYLHFDSIVSDPSRVFSNLKDLTDRRAFHPYALSTSKKGTLWSMINKYPENSMADANDAFRACIREEDPAKHTFSKKSTENGVAVGPLEYCANGRVFKSGSRVIVLPVRGYLSPGLSEWDVKQVATREWRKEFEEKERARVRKEANREGREPRPAELNYVRHRALTDSEKRQRDRKVAAALREVRNMWPLEASSPSCMSASSSTLENTDPLEVERPKKRRKRDNDLVIEGQENIIPDPVQTGSLSRRCSRRSL